MAGIQDEAAPVVLAVSAAYKESKVVVGFSPHRLEK